MLASLECLTVLFMILKDKYVKNVLRVIDYPLKILIANSALGKEKQEFKRILNVVTSNLQIRVIMDFAIELQRLQMTKA